jgi:hypothetical protein
MYTDSRHVVLGLATPLTMELACRIRAVYGGEFSIGALHASRLFFMMTE